ncbi:pentatricopeptide repeat-containing protein At1g05600 [Andrographis paniculata]|uniref:pentatricopeptide repeat-containing protein At1g05600 n=1 Tax=Andrographis paniculata TaxID=175694 RepID=UPI0021E7314E|nr:pentatricopeptide repeat-containing protein At1g05600 [Andrographis paniculata]
MCVRWPRLLSPTHLSQLIRRQKNPLTALDLFNEAQTRYPSYRHNGPVYATMINILRSSGRIIEMKEVVNRMKEDLCPCRDSVIAGVIETYMDAGMVEDAISLFKSLPEFNCVNYTRSFHTLLEKLVRDSKLETCCQLFVEHCRGWEISSRMYSLNLLMDVLCRMRRSDLAIRVFQEMGNQWCDPGRETYRILMRGLCNDGRLSDATQLLFLMFGRISRKGCGADVSIYRMLLEALCDNGDVDEAVEILGKILRRGLRVPKRYFKQLDKTQFRVEDVKSLINEALIRGGVPSSDSYRAMAVDLYSEGNIVGGDNVLDEMREKGFRSSPQIFEAKIAALFAAGEVDRAVECVRNDMIENGCVPTVRVHNAVVKGLCDAGESARAVRYFGTMSKQVGIVPDRETYVYLVDGLCCDGDYAEASRVMDKMVMSSFWPSDEMYTKVIRGLCSTGKTFTAAVFLEEMIGQGKIPAASVWCSLVSSVVCREVLWKEVLFVTLRELEN